MHIGLAKRALKRLDDRDAMWSEIGIAKDMKEAEAALSLSLKAFYPEGPPAGSQDLWKYKWFKDPTFDLRNLFIIKDGAGRIVGGLRIVSRNLRRIDQIFKMFGIAETFVDRDNQGKGFGVLLTDYAIQEGKLRGYDILAVVARRLIDYFYLRFGGLFGMGAYNEVLLHGWHDSMRAATEFSASEISLQDIAEVNTAYEYSYFNSFGPMKRTFDHWKFLVEKILLQGEEIKIITKVDGIVGYFVTREEQILEIGLLPGIPYRPVLEFLYYNVLKNNSQGELRLKIPYTHKLLDEDLKLDVTVKNRECYYGGHIVKVLNKKRVMSLMEGRLGDLLAAKLNRPMDFAVGNVTVTYDGKGPKVSYCSDSDPSYQETLFLMGATSVYGKKQPPQTIEGLPFVLCEIDEF